MGLMSRLRCAGVHGDASCVSRTIASRNDGVMTKSAPMLRLHAGQPQREWRRVVRLTEILHIAVNEDG
jgi:hypothetical protein